MTVVRRGQLAAVGVVAPGDQAGVERLLEAAAPPELFDGPPPRHLADEVNLVTRWLEGAAGKAEPRRPGPPGQPRHRRRPAPAPLRPRPPPPRLAPGEARGRPEARPSRRPTRRHHSGSFATAPGRTRARLAGYCRIRLSVE